MVKKLVAIGVAIVFLVFMGAIWQNINSNAVYYAVHCPHEQETRPILVEVCNHIWSVDGPDLKAPDIEKTGVSYDIDWRVKYQTIHNDKYNLMLAKSNVDKNIYASFDTDYGDPDKEGKERVLVFNPSGKLIAITTNDEHGGEKKERLSLQSKEEYLRKIDRTLDEIIVSQPNQSPKINLQWIYNLLNYKRFN